LVAKCERVQRTEVRQKEKGRTRRLFGGYHLLVDFGPRSPSQMTDGSLPSQSVNT